MWQFSQAVEGLADGCLELEIPVTGGNVSFYNQTGDVPIHPTPVVAVLGVIDDVAAASRAGWQDEGDNIYLLGVTRDRARRLGVGRHRARPPRRASAGGRPRRREEARRAARAPRTEQSLISAPTTSPTAASRQALAEAVLRFGVGARVWLARDHGARRRRCRDRPVLGVDRPRARDACRARTTCKFRGLCEGRGYPVLRIGVTDAGDGGAPRGAGPLHRVSGRAAHHTPGHARRQVRGGRRALAGWWGSVDGGSRSLSPRQGARSSPCTGAGATLGVAAIPARPSREAEPEFPGNPVGLLSSSSRYRVSIAPVEAICSWC